MTIAIISHPDCCLHHAGVNHPESPDRVKVVQMALERYPFKTPVTFNEAPMASREQLIRAHDPNYVDWIYRIAPKPKQDPIAIDEDTWMNAYTLQAALRAAGAVPFAVDLVMQQKLEAAFCNIRPPGHHAEHEKAMGFCFFNNVAIGVMHAMKQHHLKHIAIIDFDVHHGNGTQEIFQNNSQVLYCSSFQHPLYPGYDDELDNAHILNVPLAQGSGSKEFRTQVEAAWFEKIAAFKPEFIFFSAGFDAHLNDPLAQLQLSKEDYVWVTNQIAKIAAVHCEGRMVSALEGGYNLEALAECVPRHVEAMQIK